MKNDILNPDDIRVLVDSFYIKVREDSLLSGIFNERIQGHWPEHLEKMYRFWQTVLLDEHSYHGSPFVPHARMPLEKEHFERWITLFYATIDEHFSGSKSEEAKWRAGKMAEMFLHKISYYRSHPEKQVL